MRLGSAWAAVAIFAATLVAAALGTLVFVFHLTTRGATRGLATRRLEIGAGTTLFRDALPGAPLLGCVGLLLLLTNQYWRLKSEAVEVPRRSAKATCR